MNGISSPGRRWPARKTQSARSGFTLLEVVISLALLMFLVSLIYTALNSYWDLSSRGRDQIQRSQVTRALFDKIGLDLRSVVFVPREEEEETDEDEGAVAATMDTMLSSVDTDLAFEEAATGLVGNATSLLLHVSRPRIGAQYVDLASAMDATQQTSDEQLVLYVLAVQGGPGMSGTIGSALDDEFESRTDIRGLARVTGDALQMQSSDLAIDTNLLAENAKLWANEIVSIEFAYYENGEVYDVWDSREYNRLPQAVEIRLGLRKDQREFSDNFRATSSMDAPAKVVRKVIALPLAAPYIEETY